MLGLPSYLRNRMSLRWRRHVVYPVCRRLYRDSGRETSRCIVVAGTARSGTTWVGDIISSQLPCRVMFEPFHARKVDAYRHFNYFQYMRPGAENPTLRAYCERVFTGQIRNDWIDRQVAHLRPRYRLIKEIRANLFLKWAKNEFPNVPFFLVLRHPCAVVLSRLKLGWATDADLEPFLVQPDLVDDYLGDKLDSLRRARSDEAKHALVWCINNLVPLTQFDAHELTITYYEHLRIYPESEVPRLFHALGRTPKASVFKRLHTPSWTTRPTSAIMRAENNIGGWRRELSPRQISNVLSVVKDFGLEHLYGDSMMPLQPPDRGREGPASSA